MADNDYTLDKFTHGDLQAELSLAEDVESRFSYEFEDGKVHVQTYDVEGNHAKKYVIDYTITEVPL